MNGKPAGVKMWRPYLFDITDFIRHGRNELEIAVTNTLANSMSKIELTSGLIGPVEILSKKETA